MLRLMGQALCWIRTSVHVLWDFFFRRGGTRCACYVKLATCDVSTDNTSDRFLLSRIEKTDIGRLHHTRRLQNSLPSVAVDARLWDCSWTNDRDSGIVTMLVGLGQIEGIVEKIWLGNGHILIDSSAGCSWLLKLTPTNCIMLHAAPVERLWLSMASAGLSKTMVATCNGHWPVPFTDLSIKMSWAMMQTVSLLCYSIH